jgi:hypothetical protein
VSSTTVGRLLYDLGYSLQSVRKSREGTSHPDRTAQFELVNATAAVFLQDRQPVISVDTKKKELVGGFKNADQEWYPAGQPETARVHDFPTDAVGKAIRRRCRVARCSASRRWLPGSSHRSRRSSRAGAWPRPTVPAPR